MGSMAGKCVVGRKDGRRYGGRDFAEQPVACLAHLREAFIVLELRIRAPEVAEAGDLGARVHELQLAHRLDDGQRLRIDIAQFGRLRRLDVIPPALRKSGPFQRFIDARKRAGRAQKEEKQPRPVIRMARPRVTNGDATRGAGAFFPRLRRLLRERHSTRPTPPPPGTISGRRREGEDERKENAS